MFIKRYLNEVGRVHVVVPYLLNKYLYLLSLPISIRISIMRVFTYFFNIHGYFQKKKINILQHILIINLNKNMMHTFINFKSSANNSFK